MRVRPREAHRQRGLAQPPSLGRAKHEEELRARVVKADFDNRGLVNQLREIIQDYVRTEKRLEETVHGVHQIADSLRRDYKYARRDLLHWQAEAIAHKDRNARLSGAVMALTKNREDFLVKLHEQGELKKRIPSSARTQIGGLIEAAYDRMEADNEESLRTLLTQC